MQTASISKNANALPTYLFAKVDPQKLEDVLESLEDLGYVDWYGSTTGRYDLALALKGSDLKQVYSTIKEIRDIEGVESTTSFIPFEGYVRKETEDEDEERGSLGQVFLRTRGDSEDVLASLKKLPVVSEVVVVPGEWDVVATVRGGSYEDILKTTIEEIARIDGVSASETSFVYQPKSAA